MCANKDVHFQVPERCPEPLFRNIERLPEKKVTSLFLSSSNLTLERPSRMVPGPARTARAQARARTNSREKKSTRTEEN